MINNKKDALKTHVSLITYSTRYNFKIMMATVTSCFTQSFLQHAISRVSENRLSVMCLRPPFVVHLNLLQWLVSKPESFCPYRDLNRRRIGLHASLAAKTGQHPSDLSQFWNLECCKNLEKLPSEFNWRIFPNISSWTLSVARSSQFSSSFAFGKPLAKNRNR